MDLDEIMGMDDESEFGTEPPTPRSRRTLRDGSKPYVSQSAREAIEAAIEKVGYVRNTAARNLATQSSGAVALIVHEPHSVFVEDPNIGAILLGTNAALSEADYQLVSLIIDTEPRYKNAEGLKEDFN